MPASFVLKPSRAFQTDAVCHRTPVKWRSVDRPLLAIEDATELGMALASEAVRRVGGRALVIKGAAATSHRTRPSRPSADVDLLVDPVVVPALTRELGHWGWHERSASKISRELSSHARVLIHHSWPCDLDLHRAVPGMLRDPTLVFDVLWQRRSIMAAGGNEVYCADRDASVLIQALHSLRGASQSPRHCEEFAYLVSSVLPELSGSQQADLVELAWSLGAEGTCWPLLRHLDVELGELSRERRKLASQWLDLERYGADRTAKLVQRMAGMPLREKADLLWALAWPTRTDIRIERPASSDSRIGVLGARLQRVAIGLWRFPRTVKLVRRSKRRGWTSLADSDDS